MENYLVPCVRTTTCPLVLLPTQPPQPICPFITHFINIRKIDIKTLLLALFRGSSHTPSPHGLGDSPLTSWLSCAAYSGLFWLSVQGQGCCHGGTSSSELVTTHPIQYQAPLFRALASDGSMRIRWSYFSNLPDASAPGRWASACPFTGMCLCSMVTIGEWQRPNPEPAGAKAQYLRLWASQAYG